ncbi:hypothetical protein Tco_1487987 [Tanacetum coccineum]
MGADGYAYPTGRPFSFWVYDQTYELTNIIVDVFECHFHVYQIKVYDLVSCAMNGIVTSRVSATYGVSQISPAASAQNRALSPRCIPPPDNEAIDVSDHEVVEVVEVPCLQN